MTSAKLSLNQDLKTKTSAMELIHKRSKLSGFGTNINMSNGSITLPPLCDIIKLKDDCQNLLLTSQVCYFSYNFYKN